MLNPDSRQLYTDALRPPPGYQFTEAVATTYSLDLETLLTIPLHLALFSSDRPLEELLKDGVALLEALRRTVRAVTVYAQGSRVIAPSQPHVLFGLLEPVVVEVVPPSANGSFHPKLWLIRFDNPATGAVRLRLLVLSRNITGDRCWDLSLTLEGEPGKKRRAANRELAELLTLLPTMALAEQSVERAESTRALAELALTTDWELPSSYDSVTFHALGHKRRAGWLPRESDRLIVISPFVSATALEALLGSTGQAVALVSRQEELDAIESTVLQRFERVMVLSEQAELEDGEELSAISRAGEPLYGLHAKAYLVKRGWDTHVYVGSANATNPALMYGTNVELVAELAGRRSKVGAVDDLLDPKGMGSILMDYVRNEDSAEEAPEVASAREALERARRKMAGLGLRIGFEERDSGWAARIIPAQSLEIDGIHAIRTWLVTRRDDTAVGADGLMAGEAVDLPDSPLSLLTTFVAFELTAGADGEAVRFVLSLEAENMPVAERDAAIVRDVIRNRDGFLRYVMMLLAEAGEGGDVFGSGVGSWGRVKSRGTEDDLPLFEHLTRAFCREPERLDSIRDLLREIGPNGEVVPPEFLDLWSIFEVALRDGREVSA